MSIFTKIADRWRMEPEFKIGSRVEFAFPLSYQPGELRGVWQITSVEPIAISTFERLLQFLGGQRPEISYCISSESRSVSTIVPERYIQTFTPPKLDDKLHLRPVDPELIKDYQILSSL